MARLSCGASVCVFMFEVDSTLSVIFFCNRVSLRSVNQGGVRASQDKKSGTQYLESSRRTATTPRRGPCHAMQLTQPEDNMKRPVW
jgi:hypothetical protein